jgi:methylmalonyl-CoA mutase
MALPEKKKWPFDATTKKDWAEIARQEWESAPEAEKKNIPGSYYFDRSDLPSHTPSQFSPSTGFLGARAWVNMPLISGATDRQANQTARTWLNSGADGILIDLTENASPEILLEGIELPHCSICFLADTVQEDFFQRFAAFAYAKNYDPASITGALFWNILPPHAETLIDLFTGWKQFRAFGFLDNEEKKPDERIASLLAKAVMQLGSRPQKNAIDMLRSMAFSVPIGTDFFTEIATLKALRRLWYQVVSAYARRTNIPAFIHGLSHTWKNDHYLPHGHLLKSTTAAMSAVLGGCDALTLLAETPANPTMERLARNISSLLREESYLAEVADPTAGSYYLERLADDIARSAWTKFQAMV